MSQSLTRKRSTQSLSRQESDQSGTRVRVEKKVEATSRRYEVLLLTAGIHMDEPEISLQATEADEAFCRELLNKVQSVPKDSLFNDELLKSTLADIANRNEARVVQDIARLIVPAPEELFRRGATQYKHLIETVSEGWYKSIPLVGSQPQSDFAVGLKPSAFTPEQRRKLQPSIGGWDLTSRLAATDEMYFPFLTAEVKCGNEALNIADRQNAHAAAVAANAVVELYGLVSRREELHRKILTFSVSHDHRGVRIYGHYVLINGKETSFYRHTLRTYDINDQHGKDKWTAYMFTLNVYNDFRPIHQARITSVIDQLPEPEVFVVQTPSQQTNITSSVPNDNQSIISYPQQAEPGAPSPQTSEPVFKKPRGKGKR